MSTSTVDQSLYKGMGAHPSCEKIFCTLISNPYNLVEGNKWYHTLAKVLLTVLVILTTAFITLIPIIIFALDSAKSSESESEDEGEYSTYSSNTSYSEGSNENQKDLKSSTSVPNLIFNIIKGVDYSRLDPGESPGAYVDPEGDPVPVTDATWALITEVLNGTDDSDSN